MIPKVTGLHPKLAEKIDSLLKEAKARGFSVGMHSGLRTWEKQAELYELGRSIVNPDGTTLANPRGAIVTKTTAGFSWHNYGTAADIVFKDIKGNWTWDKTDDQWEDLGKIGEMLGLVWGGRWKQRDCPHFELKMSLDVFKAYDLAQSTGEVDAVWQSTT